ncbi:MAG: hypothetical protein IJV89_05270 [Lentisphaeria bacterium]|nr:hypothetical protein [Lentisphaeria bacterium]
MLNDLKLKHFLKEDLPFPRRAALFLSGQGSNAEAVLNDLAESPADYVISVLVTDNPERSRARELSEKFGVPLIGHDLKKFYADHGAASTSLATEAGRRLRALWTDDLRKKLAEYPVDFGILAGFMTLCNIAEDFPCLNVHPGDLTVTDAAGRRILAGLHSGPVEEVLCSPELNSFRSSVIVVRPFSGDGAEDMDTGFILGVSGAVPAYRAGRTAEDWQLVRRNRVPGGRVKDSLRSLALENIENLKVLGDHVVLPAVLRQFASGNYAHKDGQLFCKDVHGNWAAVQTVCYSSSSEMVLWK